MNIKLHDPTVFRVYQWLQQDPKRPETASEFVRAFKEHFDRTFQTFKEFCKKEFQKDLGDYRIDLDEEEKPKRRHVRKRVLSSEPPEGFPSIDAHMQLDMFYFYFLVLKEGEFYPSEAVVPMPPVEKPPEHEAFIGDGYILYAELKDFDEHDENELKEASAEFIEAQKIVEDTKDNISENLITLRKDNFFLAFLNPLAFRDVPECIAVVLLPQEVAQEEWTMTLLYGSAMDILLQIIRLAHIYQVYEEKGLREEVFARERQLDGLLRALAASGTEIGRNKRLRRISARLKRRKIHKFTLKELEDSVIRIFEEQKRFIEDVSQVQELINAGKIALRNFELISRDKPIEDGTLGNSLVNRMKFVVEQMEGDCRFFDITRQQAELALSSLHTRTEIEENRAERVLAILFGIFVVFEFIQAFPEIPLITRIFISIFGISTVFYLVKHKFEKLTRWLT